MNDSPLYLILFIAVMAAATFVTRVAPFVLLRGKGEHPVLIFLGRYLPPAIMLLLLIYCFKDVVWFVEGQGYAEIVSLTVVAGVHLWLRNPLVSILAGTALYMAMRQGILF